MPLVLLCLGFADLTLGLMPRAVAEIGVLPVADGFLWLVIADSIGAPTWIGDLSPLAPTWPPSPPPPRTGPPPPS